MPPPHFLTDAMLGGLTRWLRVLGYDTLFNPAQEDKQLVARANDEQRVLLTRDKHLVTHLRPRASLLLQSQVPLEQLREVVVELRLAPPASLFQRCLVCNSELRDLKPAEAAEQVPPDARELPGPVRYCDFCHKTYWQGSHAWRMRATLEQHLGDWLGH